MSQASESVARTYPRTVKRKSLHHWTLVGAAVLAFALPVERSAAGNREHDGDIWFVHATDPHLFLKAVQVDGKTDGKIQEELGKKRRQEELNENALTDMLTHIRSLPDGDGPPAFLLLTGDLGIDPCEICQAQNQTTIPPAAKSEARPAETDGAPTLEKQKKLSVPDCLKVAEKQRKPQIEAVARILGQSPVRNIYLVAGNNDIANESAGDEALNYFNKFIDDVQKELVKDQSSVVLHNLSRCYASNESANGCYADIDGADYRLIGFPSYSFKNTSDEAGVDHSQAQARQFETFRQLLEQAHQAKRKVLVITHTPSMDDPFALAQQRYVNPKATPTAPPTSPTTTAPASPTTRATASAAPAGTATPTETPTPAGTATAAQKTKNAQTQTDKPVSVMTWNVDDQLLTEWHGAIKAESMAGVFAGHLHDSHKEIYRRPYAWSNGSPGAFRKLFLAPPLAVKNQDKSPIQARGFSLVHLKPDRVESRLFWYDSETRTFTPDSKPKLRPERRGFWWRCCEDCRVAIRWLWSLDTANPLERMAVLLIAFLTAFLTIVAIWQIPPASDPFAEGRKAAGDSKPAQTPSNAGADSLPFSSKFGKTVIAGLGGLVAAEVTKTLGNEKPTADSRWFYIVWFVLFFFFCCCHSTSCALLWRRYGHEWRSFITRRRSLEPVRLFGPDSQTGFGTG